MTRPTLLPALALLLVLPACGVGGLLDDVQAVPAGGSGTSEAMSSGEREWALQILERVNAEREAQELPALAWHEPAAETAYAHAYDMDARDFFDHVNPDGETPSARMSAAGIEWSTMGENIARGYDGPGDVMEGWMGSAGHRANILNPEFTHLGVGIHTDSGGGPWWVQEFLRPVDR